MRPANTESTNYCSVQHQDGEGNYKFPLYTHPPKTKMERKEIENGSWRTEVFHPIPKVWTLTEVQHKLEHRLRSQGPTLHLRGTIIVAGSVVKH